MLGGIGSTGIVIGLATWGWRIMRVLGVKMTCITPSRGFTMETTTALVSISNGISHGCCKCGGHVGRGLLSVFGTKMTCITPPRGFAMETTTDLVRSASVINIVSVSFVLAGPRSVVAYGAHQACAYDGAIL